VTRNAPSLWDGGIEWDTVSTAGATGYWASATAPDRAGKPYLSVAIAGRRYPDANQSASWSLGRSDWLSVLSPTSASLSFFGSIQAVPNDVIVISLMVDDAGAGAGDDKSIPSPALWIGRVDSVEVSQTTDGNYWTNITGTDIIGILGQAMAPSSIAASTLDSLVETLALGAGQTVVVNHGYTLPSLVADASIDGTVLDLINRAERSSNALLFLKGAGNLYAMQRQAIVTAIIRTIPLTGLDTPSSWTEQTSVSSVINDWSFTDEATSWGPTTSSDATSQAAYGKRSYSVSDMLTTDATPYTDLYAGGVLATPRAVLTGAEFPIYDLSQKVLYLDPLEWISRDDDTWQVMSVSHDVTPGDWRMTITADQTQNALTDVANPDPEDPDPPPDTTTTTVSYVSTKSGVAYKSSGGAYYGNGADDYLSVGYYAGTRTRSCIQFPIDWGDFPGFIRVKKAVMTLRTTGQVRVAFGSDPRFYCKRITESWNEGSTTYPNDANGGQLVWPGPAATSSGQVLKDIGTSENNDITVTITDIAQGWKDSGHNYGLRLMSANEDNSSRTTEFYSDDYSTSGFRPEITITCEVTA
jgi:hypothetical protein